MAASILGAYVIQFLTTTLYKFNVSSSALPAYKAVVVIILVVLSTPTVRRLLAKAKEAIMGTFLRKPAATENGEVVK
jgi:simple sugar transport system permease protein